MKKKLVFALITAVALSLCACGNTAAPQPKTESAPVKEAAEVVLVDNDDITFTLKSIDPDGGAGYTLKCYVENKTDEELLFTAENTSVNGFMADPFWSVSVPAGKNANTMIVFMSLESNGIEDVNEIEFDLLVMPGSDNVYDRERAVFNDKITIKP